MPHDTALIATIAVGLGLAFVFGLLASRLTLPPILGYLLAGVAVGPFTPGFVADSGLASQLSEIGVILLMFGVGLHFSIADLLSVRRIAIPGAIAQISVATLLGAVVSRFWGGRGGRGSSSDCRCPWPARWCSCARSRIEASSTRSTAGSRSAG